MGTCFLYGNGGGGGTQLNFAIVGGTVQPENPKDNTIWVNTDTEITSWAFSATEPESPVEGMVWISTGTSSTVEFNALKKNGIQVYPISAKQYVSGVLESKTVLAYTSGAWRDLVTYLYNEGSQYPSITGGWIKTGTGTFTLGENYMQIGPAGSAKNVRGVTKNKVDVSGLRSLKLIYTCTNANAYPRFGISSEQEPDDRGGWISYVSLDKTTNDAEINLDISGITGSYYITISTYTSGSSATILVKKVLGVS